MKTNFLQSVFLAFAIASTVVYGQSVNRLEVEMVPMVKVTGDVGATYQIQFSTALSQPVHWQALTNLVLSNNPTLFMDTSASGSQKRFYQAVEQINQTEPDSRRFVWIPPGSFLMGSPVTEEDRNANDGAQIKVTFSRGFWIGKYEVTQEEFKNVMLYNPKIPHLVDNDDLRRPAEGVNWMEATNYCGKITKKERIAGRLPNGYVYRLPTEAEWEYACRAGTSTRFSFGDDPDYSQLPEYAWFNSAAVGELPDIWLTQPVGQKKPNSWGLFDMHGNMMEWCLACRCTGGNVVDPEGDSTYGQGRVARGGSIYTIGSACRSACRMLPSGGVALYSGFRVVLAKSK